MRADARRRVRRVLMTADGVGGVWTYAVDLARGLAAHDVTVALATMGPPLSDDQRVEAASVGASVFESPVRLEWMHDPWTDVDNAADWLLDLERTVDPDVVHLNGYCHGALPWSAPALVVGHSCVCSWWRAVHGVAAPCDCDEYRERVRRGLRAAALVVTPTHAMRRALAAEYGELGDVRVIPNGRTDATSVEPRQPIVFAAGRIWDEAKNIGMLARAACHISWPVYIAGDAGDRPASPDGARYLGKLTPAGMRQWYARAAIYALPARYEPFGLSVLEAAQAGCALVLGDIESLRENWTDAALFVRPDDETALTQALSRLIHDPEARRELGRRARLRARDFGVDRMVDQYRHAYESLVNGDAIDGLASVRQTEDRWPAHA